MEHCRSLKFEADPDYKYCIGLFDKCMKRNNLDPKLLDYTWKQNRLSKDKELLKSSMLDVIRKKPKVEKTVGNNSNHPRESGNPVNSGMNTGMGAMQGYNGGTQAGGTMMGMQQAPAAYQQPPLQNAQAQGRATYTK
jgi:hypothetical protein